MKRFIRKYLIPSSRASVMPDGRIRLTNKLRIKTDRYTYAEKSIVNPTGITMCDRWFTPYQITYVESFNRFFVFCVSYITDKQPNPYLFWYINSFFTHEYTLNEFLLLRKPKNDTKRKFFGSYVVSFSFISLWLIHLCESIVNISIWWEKTEWWCIEVAVYSAMMKEIYFMDCFFQRRMWCLSLVYSANLFILFTIYFYHFYYHKAINNGCESLFLINACRLTLYHTRNCHFSTTRFLKRHTD